jgi:hypothetical protein
MLSKDKPEELLLNHVTFIVDNYKHMDDEAVWRDCRLFDEDSVIHVVIPKYPAKEDSATVSNITPPTRKSRRTVSASPHHAEGMMSQDSRRGGKSPRGGENS